MGIKKEDVIMVVSGTSDGYFFILINPSVNKPEIENLLNA